MSSGEGTQAYELGAASVYALMASKADEGQANNKVEVRRGDGAAVAALSLPESSPCWRAGGGEISCLPLQHAR